MEMTPAQIKNYLQGRCSEQEALLVKKWLAVPGNADAARAVLGDLWTNYEPVLKSGEMDVERLLLRTQFRLRNDSKSSKQGNRFWTVFSRVAAVLIFPLCLFTAYLYFDTDDFNLPQAQNPMREISTKPGTRLHFHLADGTEVWLNDGTTMRYPEYFTGNERKVFVDGEAYFEVKADKAHPFIVENPMINTVVTGTHFNLNAYSEDSFFEATLLEGKIELKGESVSGELKPGQQAVFSEGIGLQTKEVKAQNAVAWINGKLVIQNEKLETALKKISRWYNVDIELKNTELKNTELTCTLQDEKLEQCMALISNALSIKYAIKNLNNQQTIVLMKN